MTGDRLAEIRQRADAATPGYKRARGGVLAKFPSTSPGKAIALALVRQDWATPEDLDFIAAAREDVPWLLSAVKSLGDQNEELLDDADRDEAELAQARRALADQERFNIESRRSLCEQSDRYKAERDAAVAQLAKVRELHWRYLPPAVDYDCCAHCNSLSASHIPYPCPTVVAAGGEQS